MFVSTPVADSFTLPPVLSVHPYDEPNSRRSNNGDFVFRHVGGIPYLLLLTPLLWWMRNKTEGEMRKGLLWAPVLILLPLAFCYAVYQFGFDPALTFRDTLTMFQVFLIFFSVCTLAFGYAYVGIALGVASVLTDAKKADSSN